MADQLDRWARERAPGLLARAEAEAVAFLRDKLVRAALGEPEPRPIPASEPVPPRTGELLWAYGVVRAGEGPSCADPVFRIEAAGLAAIVRRVPRAEFDAGPLRENLNDLDWLERVARAHEAVLDEAVAAGTVVPLRLCTIFESEERVRAMLAGDAASLSEALDLLTGREELGVKMVLDPEQLAEAVRAASAEAGEAEERLAGRSAGAAYLERRRLERHVREQADALSEEVAERVHARLCDCAVAAVTRPAQNRELSGHEGHMVLNGAYLVDRARADELRALALELEWEHAGVGARVEVTGPWPPYNFLPQP